MAKEIDLTLADGLTLYMVRRIGGQFVNGTTPEAFNAAHWTNYAVALSKLVIDAGVQAEYSADLGTGLAAGVYRVDVYTQAGGTPALSDGVPTRSGTCYWGGSAEGFDLVNAPNATAVTAFANGLLDQANSIDAGGAADTVRHSIRLIAAALAGLVSGAGTTSNVFRDVANTKNRISATVDASGDRTAITYDNT